MSGRASAEIIAEYLDCVLRRDYSAVDRYFHPDIEYVVNGSPLPDRDRAIPAISAECISALPWLGHYRGKEALKQFLVHILIAKYHFIENTFDVANAFRVSGAWRVDTDGEKRDVPSATH